MMRWIKVNSYRERPFFMTYAEEHIITMELGVALYFYFFQKVNK